MRILFLTHYFPPEGNAPASRVHACARHWVGQGHEVTVITCAPNVPNGVVYPGYKNRLVQREMIDGIEVIRVWTLLAANKGTTKRVMNYVSYMIAAVWNGLFRKRPDVLIATSPQFFCGWAGLVLSKIKRVPFVLEIRDIWPESILAVGARLPKLVLSVLRRMEQHMYRNCERLVTVGQGYYDRLIEKGVPAEKMDIVMNGLDVDLFSPREAPSALRGQWGIPDDALVCSYVGTIGMACSLQVVLDAARQLREQELNHVYFLLVGDGAQRAVLENAALEQQLDHVVFTGRQDKQAIPDLLAMSDVVLVHLKKTDLFETVMPSKIFEAAGMSKPIIVGVKGSATELVLEAGAGLAMEPEASGELVERLMDFDRDRAAMAAMGASGCRFVREHFDRRRLADEYLALLTKLIRP